MVLPIEDINEMNFGDDALEICGQKFTQDEIRQAVDFADIVKSYGYTEEMLVDFIMEQFQKVGYRLYLAIHLKPEELGAMILGEEDQRIAKVIHQRCLQINREKDGRDFIILPGEIKNG